MPRARKGAARRQAKVRWFKAAKGNRGNRSRCWRKVREAVLRAGRYRTRDRRLLKREYRALWIVRLNAAARAHDMSYSQFIAGLKAANITLNRKMLSEIAIADDATFAKLVDLARTALAQAPAAAA